MASMSSAKYIRRLLQSAFAARDGYHNIHRYRRDAVSYISSKSHHDDVIIKIKNILEHAYSSTRYYRETWDDAGIDLKKIRYLEDFGKLPFITKDIIQQKKDSMVSEIFRGKLETSYTGGSSGNPTSFFRDKTCTAMRMGRQLGILELCGYDSGERCGLIWGAHADLNLSTVSGLKRKLRQFASGKKTLCCTVMDEEKMVGFHHELKMFNPDVLYGYPNAMSEFADFIIDKRLDPVRVKRIFCTAESLSNGQRKKLSDVFQGEVYNLYCTREHGCIGFECKNHNGFHIDTGSVYVETVNKKESGSNIFGDIVVTDLLNYGMPMIRNQIGDVGILSERPCSCGSDLPLLIHFNGRQTDLIYKKDGTPIAGLMLLDLMTDISEIKWIQILQDSLDVITIYLVVTDGYNKSIEQTLIRELETLFGGMTQFNIQIVDEIPRNPNSGKFQEVICRIPESDKKVKERRVS